MARTIEIHPNRERNKAFFAVRVNLAEADWAKENYCYVAQEITLPASDPVMVVGRFRTKPPAESLAQEITAGVQGKKKELVGGLQGSRLEPIYI
jgi:hypothetical protein